LYYAQHPEVYPNAQSEDAFLQQLAEGGFQVGELAKDYYPNGIEISKGSHKESADKTSELLKQENVIIYEAAFLWENCYVLADIVVKKGNKLQLIEVKAKGFNPENDSFWGKRDADKLVASWQPYLYDIAFQDYVVKKSLESSGLDSVKVLPYLMLTNKSSFATVDGLNQLYQLVSVDSEGRKKVIKNQDSNLYNIENLGAKILIEVDVQKEVEYIQQFGKVGELEFKKAVEVYSKVLLEFKENKDVYKGTIKKNPCKTCEFSDRNDDGYFSGREECLQRYANFTEKDFGTPLVWDIWNFRNSDKLFEEGRYFIKDVQREDLEPKSNKLNSDPWMSSTDRKEYQVIKTATDDNEPVVYKEELAAIMAEWKFPLHFIDFEGSRTALPFYKDMRPYEQVAFQFSHHKVFADGTLEHASEWLNMQAGYFPNFDFVRALKKVLGNDEGTVFKYATYENSVLNSIEKQLLNSDEPDKEELVSFIHTLTNDKSCGRSAGHRDMIDLCDIIKKYYYNPLTFGSNSIKYVLPAILNSSNLLQNKYSKPIYGTWEMPSKNFQNQIWVQKNAEGKIKDPYKLLHNIYDGRIDINEDDEDFGEQESSVANGGAAMSAYNEIQFTSTTPERRKELQEQLLRYCELDTLAMVMVYEELANVIKS